MKTLEGYVWEADENGVFQKTNKKTVTEVEENYLIDGVAVSKADFDKYVVENNIKIATTSERIEIVDTSSKTRSAELESKLNDFYDKEVAPELPPVVTGSLDKSHFFGLATQKTGEIIKGVAEIAKVSKYLGRMGNIFADIAGWLLRKNWKIVIITAALEIGRQLIDYLIQKQIDCGMGGNAEGSENAPIINVTNQTSTDLVNAVNAMKTDLHDLVVCLKQLIKYHEIKT